METRRVWTLLTLDTVKPLNCGHLQDRNTVSVIHKCLLYLEVSWKKHWLIFVNIEVTEYENISFVGGINKCQYNS